MNHLLSLLNIDISSSKNKGDFMIALVVILFFGGLLWWLLSPGLTSSTAPIASNSINISPENENVSPALVHDLGEENKMNEDVIKDMNSQKDEIEQTPEIILDDIEKRILKEAIQNVEFKENSVELLRSSRPSLYRIAKILKKYPDYQLSIVAYTKASEKALAQDRAKVCFDYLINEEIESDRIRFKGKGYKEVVDAENVDQEYTDRVEFNLNY